MQKCLDNREADIGRFIQRHITPDQLEVLRNIFMGTSRGKSTTADDILNEKSTVMKLLEEGYSSLQNKLNKEHLSLPKHGYYEVGFWIKDGKFPEVNNELLNTLYIHNPRCTGWSPWIILRNASDLQKKPYWENNGWESLISEIGNTMDGWNSIDFWRISNDGKFYLYRALEDDMRGKGSFEKLDFSIQVIRVAEIIGVGLAFARELSSKENNTSICFCFKWNLLDNRERGSWSKLENYVPAGEKAYKSVITSCIDVPIDTAKTSIYKYVDMVTKPLFEVFGGFSMNIQNIEDLTNRLLNRNL